MTTHVNDAGTWRTLTNIYVNDAGTWRNILETWVNDAGTWRMVFQYAKLDTTLTLGVNSSDPLDIIRGYIFGSLGSMASRTLADGTTIDQLVSSSGSGTTTLIISGFGSDPGTAYFTSLSVDGTGHTSASASYGYSGGQATWTWTGSFLGSSGTRAIIIV